MKYAPTADKSWQNGALFRKEYFPPITMPGGETTTARWALYAREMPLCSTRRVRLQGAVYALPLVLPLV